MTHTITDLTFLSLILYAIVNILSKIKRRFSKGKGVLKEQPKEIKQGFLKKIGGYLALILILSVFILPIWLICAAISSDPTPEELKERQASDLKYEAKHLLQSSMKDPDSVEFDKVYYSGKATCGLVNAKNGFGGYTGFQRFIVAQPIVMVEEQTKQKLFRDMWAKLCRPE